MYMDKLWWLKNKPTLYLLDFAIFLAISQNVIISNHFTQVNSVNGIGKNVEPVQSYAPSDLLPSFKMHNLLNDSFIRHSPAQELDVAAHMVLVSFLDREENVSIEHRPMPDSVVSTTELFNFEELYRQSDNNHAGPVLNASTSESLDNLNNFFEGDDVRWRQFLNIDDEPSTSQSRCVTSINIGDDSSEQSFFGFNDKGLCFENDVHANADRRDEGFYSSNTKPKDFFDLLELDLHNDINATSPSFSKSCMFDDFSQYQPLSNSFDAAIADEDADLMQILYEQDADLGYNWNYTENAKQLKEVDDVQLVKPDVTTLNDFFVDGETGEQIPISRNAAIQAVEPSNFIQSQISHVNTVTDTSSLSLDFDECFEMLEHTMDDMQPRKPSSQKSVEECNAMVNNLTSLLDPVENPPILQTQSSASIWQQIDELSELTGLNLHEVDQPIVTQQQQQQQQFQPGMISYNGQVPTVQQVPANLNQHVNFTSFELNNFNQSGSPSRAFENQLPQSYPIQNFSKPSDNHHSPVPTPPGYISPPMLSDDGVPMETSFAQLQASGQQNPGYTGEKLNNFGFQMGSSSPASSNPALASLPEPGQGFFDYLHQDNSVGDFAPASQATLVYSPQSNSPFLNPPVTTYPPPPLSTSPASGGVLVEEREQHLVSAVDKSGIVESYESDSGISLDQSPRGLELLALNCSEETVYNNGSSALKADPCTNEQQPFHFPELRAVQHNHTYNGTVGVKKESKRNVDISPASRESRDKKKARELNLPFALDEIILSPVEEYNEMLARTPLDPAQQALVKDIRRRGKNKVAAQNCRKRKIETITNMEDDVDRMRNKKQQLFNEQKNLEIEYEKLKLQYSRLYQQIFSSLRDDAGQPYDPKRFRLEQVEGSVLLVPHRRSDGNDPGTSGSDNIDFSKIKYERS